MNQHYNLSEILATITELNERVQELETTAHEPIAVIGMACRFPGGANSLGEYWDLLINGKDAVTEVPDDRWNLNEYYDPNPDVPNKMYCKWGGFLNQEIAGFDAKFFDISPAEANMMDPQQRVALEVAWEALENAYIKPKSLAKSKTGVFFGVSVTDYVEIAQQHSEISPYTNTGIINCVIAGRISYILGLQGPSFVVDTACSSSLVTIHQACRSLREKESNLAIVGGINLIITPGMTIGFCKGRYLSADGRCKSFDDSANGYVRGEGCGVLILKRLSDAKRDGDKILAEIRGTAVNQDGASGGLTVPNGPAQERVVKQALTDASVKPNEITYVEAHGTGTSLGDPIEINALQNVLQVDRTKEQAELVVGSVKSNIGHLESASGMASIIKVILALQNESIPQNLHFKKLNHNIKRSDIINLHIPTTALPWSRGLNKRIAGINGFAFQGTNAHVVVSESSDFVDHNSKPSFASERPLNIMHLSAKDPEALKLLVQKYIKTLERSDFADIAYTANNFRTTFNSRLCVIAKDSLDAKEQLLSWLDKADSDNILVNMAAPQEANLAMLFTGQGSQSVNMGKELYSSQPIFRKYLDQCKQILSDNKYIDKDLLSLLWGNDANLLDETKYTQPALFAFEYALYQLWAAWGVLPQIVMGHSVGEYVAACVAGVFSLEDGLKLITKRAALMHALPQNGGMAAISCSVQEVEKILNNYLNRVTIAAVNGPHNIVISGDKQAINEIVEEFNKQNIKTNLLKVSQAFHSHLLEPMLDDFRSVLETIQFKKQQIKLVSNVDGKFVDDEKISTPNYWLQHTREAVQFEAGVQTLINSGINIFLEIGPHPVLVAMARECVDEYSNNKELFWLPSIRRNKDEWRDILTGLSLLFLNGIPVNWQDFDQDYNRNKVPLPTYPFQHQKYWVEDTPPQKALSGVIRNQSHPLLGIKIVSSLNTTQTLYDCELSMQKYHFFADHKVYGNIVIPGAAYIEMALGAGQQLFEQKIGADSILTLEQIIIEQPLVIANSNESSSSREIQFFVDTNNSSSNDWQILSCIDSQQQSWVRHATGKISLQANSNSKPKNIVIDQILANFKQAVSVETLYDKFRQVGLEYGPSFRAIQEIWVKDDAAFGKIKLDNKLIDNTDYLFHPALLDNCIQVMASMFVINNDTEDAYLPFEIETIQFFGKLESVAYVYSQLGISSDTKVFNADISVFDENGKVLMLIEGFKSVRASKRELTRSITAQQVHNIKDLLYELTWKELKPTTNKITKKIKNCLILAQDMRHLSKIIHAIDNACNKVYVYEFKNEINNNLLEYIKQQAGDQSLIFERVIYYAGKPIESNPDDYLSKNSPYVECLNLTQLLVNHQILAKDGEFVVLTQGAQVVVEPSDKINLIQSPLIGLCKVIAIEHPELKCKRIDIGYSADLQDDDLASMLAAEIAANREDFIEDQIAIRNNIRFGPRLKHLAKKDDINPYQQDSYLGFTQRGEIDNLIFKPLIRKAPSKDQVEIEVIAAGLNFRDVLNVMGMYPGDPGLPGVECAGKIVAVGANVTDFKVGDEVYAETSAGFSKYTITSKYLTAHKPKNISYEQAAAIPIVFLTVHYALNKLAKLKENELILIHAAAGGIGLAAIQIAKLCKAEIFVTVGSEAKRDLMLSLGIPNDHIMNSRDTSYFNQIMTITQNKGVDVVLNSLTTGDFIEKSMAALKPGGKFLEIGKRDIWTHEQVAKLNKDIDYHIIAIDAMSEIEPENINKMLNELTVQFANGDLKPITIKEYPISEAKEAFKFMAKGAHTGKIVLTMQKPKNNQEVFKRVKIKDVGTYLITGGLGGLGLKCSQWLIENGAKSIILTSRSNPSNDTQAEIEAWQKQGVDVKVILADIGSMIDIERLFKEITVDKQPILGIIHAAGILKDANIKNQSFESYIAVIKPKILGALYIQEQLQKHGIKPDFYVSFASIASLLGNIGQANYAAANSFLDGFAFYLRQQNILGITIDWGPWGEVGLAANMDKSSYDQMNLTGMYAINPKVGIAALEELLINFSNKENAAVLEIDWTKFIQQSIPNAVMSEMAISKNNNSYNSQTISSNAFVDKLKMLNKEERDETLAIYLENEIRKVLGLDASIVIDHNAGFTTLGMDSLMAVEFRNRLVKNLGDSFKKPLSATLTFNYPNIKSLRGYLISEILQIEDFINSANTYEIETSQQNIEKPVALDVDNATDAELEAELEKLMKIAEDKLNRASKDEG